MWATTLPAVAASMAKRVPRAAVSRSVVPRARGNPPFRCFAASSETDIVSPLIGLTEDQKAYHLLAEKFSQEELAPFAAEWDREKLFPEDALRKAAELGFGAVFASEEHGGIGLSRSDGCVIFEALAAGCTSTTAYLTIHNMVVWMVDKFGTHEQRARFLPELVTMEHFASYCLTEPGAGSDASGISTKATKDGDDFILNGTKAFISGGGRSDVYLVMCRTGDSGPSGISAFLVEKDMPGVSFGAQERKLGWNTQPTSMVILEDVRVPAANMLGGLEMEGQGFKIAMQGLDGGRLSIGTCSVGAAFTCFNLARDHIKVRTQFGKPLAANQHLQFKLADMATDLQTARMMIRQGAAMLDSKHDNARSFCAMAKRVSTDLSFGVCNEALQMHGGYGYLMDYPIERYLRDVRVHQILEGTNEIMRLIISRELLKE